MFISGGVWHTAHSRPLNRGVEKPQAANEHLDQVRFKVPNNPGSMCSLDYNDSEIMSFFFSFCLYLKQR